MRAAAALHCRERARHGRFWGNLGSIFFDQKSTFFNFDFDKKWFGGVLDELAVEKKNCEPFFFP